MGEADRELIGEGTKIEVSHQLGTELRAGLARERLDGALADLAKA